MHACMWLLESITHSQERYRSVQSDFSDYKDRNDSVARYQFIDFLNIYVHSLNDAGEPQKYSMIYGQMNASIYIYIYIEM